MFDFLQFDIHDFPDRAIRHSLKDPDNLKELIGAAYSEFAARCNFKKIQWIPREFLMEDWRRRESDLIFLVPYEVDGEERTVLVCVLLEHQSKPDSRMPLRMLIYAVLYWERCKT